MEISPMVLNWHENLGNCDHNLLIENEFNKNKGVQ